jgi:hypothetical protein
MTRAAATDADIPRPGRSTVLGALVAALVLTLGVLLTAPDPASGATTAALVPAPPAVTGMTAAGPVTGGPTGPAASAEAGPADEADGHRGAWGTGRRPTSRTVWSVMPAVTAVLLIAGVGAAGRRTGDRPVVTAWWGVTTLTRGPPPDVA